MSPSDPAHLVDSPDLIRVEFVSEVGNIDSLLGDSWTRLESIFADTLFAHGITQGTVSVLFCDDEQIARLNRDFRGVDSPTDVLTFPAEVEDLVTGETHLGDIAISVPMAQHQASLRCVGLTDELSMLLIHGGLHLVGFDDVTDELQAEMHSEMQRAALRWNLPSEPKWMSLYNADSPEAVA